MSAAASSDGLVGRADLRVGGRTAACYHRPHGGAGPSGDRLRLAARPDGGLALLLADAPGHGAMGGAFWDAHGPAVDAAWAELAAGPGDAAAVRRLAERTNDALHGAPADAHLCLAAGVLDPTGRLVYACCGYGVHLLAATPAGSWLPASTEARFGLKLGWTPSARWPEIRPLVVHDVPAVRRVAGLTDGFLGDDHRDVPGTLDLVATLGEQVARADSAGAALDVLAALPHEEDDACAFVVDA